MGFSSTSTKIGFVCDDGRMRRATQLLRSSFTSNVRSVSEPSATMVFFATG